MRLGRVSFAIRTAKLWNSLPVSVTNNGFSIALFKNSLLDIDLLPFVRGRVLHGQ